MAVRPAVTSRSIRFSNTASVPSVTATRTRRFATAAEVTSRRRAETRTHTSPPGTATFTPAPAAGSATRTVRYRRSAGTMPQGSGSPMRSTAPPLRDQRQEVRLRRGARRAGLRGREHVDRRGAGREVLLDRDRGRHGHGAGVLGHHGLPDPRARHPGTAHAQGHGGGANRAGHPHGTLEHDVTVGELTDD